MHCLTMHSGDVKPFSARVGNGSHPDRFCLSRNHFFQIREKRLTLAYSCVPSHSVPKYRVSYVDRSMPRELQLFFSGFIKSLYDIEPKYLIFDKNKQNSDKRELTIRRTDNLALKVEEVATAVEGVSIRIEPGAGVADVKLVISLDQGHALKHAWGEIAVT